MFCLAVLFVRSAANGSDRKHTGSLGVPGSNALIRGQRKAVDCRDWCPEKSSYPVFKGPVTMNRIQRWKQVVYKQ